MIEEIFVAGSGVEQGNPSGLETGNLPEKPSGQKPEGTPPEKPGSEGGMQGQDESLISHKGVITFLEDTNISGQTYSSVGDNEHAILVTGGTVTISDTNIYKLGDASGDTADFYGTNAAVIAVDGILELNNDFVNTDGAHANAVFAYGDGEVQISDTNIETAGDNSGGIMVTGGGKLTANNVTVSTKGNSSAAIRSDRGGGIIKVDGGTYKTTGVGSPAIYSTADIIVKNAQLIATKSEGAIVEGKNSITIMNSTLIDSNLSLNGQSTTYKNIFLYQSMSGDADEGTASFTAKNSKIVTEKGDTIYVTNTTAKVLLENNEISNTEGDFMRIEGAAWGKEGSNGGDVTLNLVNQNVKGNIVVDEISSLNMELKDGSNFEGAINSENQSQNISIKLDADSTWTLQSDSYISGIKSDMTGYSNINLNGYTLYVGENAITSTDLLVQNETVAMVEVTEEEGYTPTELVLGGIGVVAIVVALGMCISTYFRK